MRLETGVLVRIRHWHGDYAMHHIGSLALTGAPIQLSAEEMLFPSEGIVSHDVFPHPATA